MLTPVMISLSEALSGRPVSELMAELTGISPQWLRKRLALPSRPSRRAAAEKNIAQAFANALIEAGLDPVEAQRRTQERPEGLLESAIYHLGYFSDGLHPVGLAELRRLDEIDAQIGRFVDARDLEGLWAWLSAVDGIAERLRRPICAAGVPHWPGDAAEPSLENIQARLSTVLVHQLLAFLAVLDHEVKPVVATPDWGGHSLVGTLIAPPASPCARRQILSPIALLIDLIIASAMADSDGRLPDCRPTPSEVGESMARRGLGGAAFDQRVHRLRSGHATLPGSVFKAFVREVRYRPAGPGQTLDDEARMVFPLLVAAHLLSLMMPSAPGSPHHDRRGWREAYLDWWRHHAMARGVPHEPSDAAGPPGWVTFDQSSRSRQSSGRSS